MSALEVQVGSTITDGGCVVRVTERHGEGWSGPLISLTLGEETGIECLVPDDRLHHYRHVPFEWTAMPDTRVEERYVWEPGWRALRHEVRVTQDTHDMGICGGAAAGCRFVPCAPIVEMVGPQ